MLRVFRKTKATASLVISNSFRLATSQFISFFSVVVFAIYTKPALLNFVEEILDKFQVLSTKMNDVTSLIYEGVLKKDNSINLAEKNNVADLDKKTTLESIENSAIETLINSRTSLTEPVSVSDSSKILDTEDMALVTFMSFISTDMLSTGLESIKFLKINSPSLNAFSSMKSPLGLDEGLNSSEIIIFLIDSFRVNIKLDSAQLVSSVEISLSLFEDKSESFLLTENLFNRDSTIFNITSLINYSTNNDSANDAGTNNEFTSSDLNLDLSSDLSVFYSNLFNWS